MTQISVPAAARAATTLARVDYEDAFEAPANRAQERTAEEWARVLLEGAPAATRKALRSGWTALGLKIGAADDERLVLGWEVRHATPDLVLLGAGSRLGLDGEVFLERRPQALVAGTFVRLANPVMRAVWAVIGGGHRQTVRRLLEQGTRR